MSTSRHLPPFPTKIETPILGKTTTWNAWNEVGPNKGRVVGDELILIVGASVDVGTALLDGRDMPRIAAGIQLKQRSGSIIRWNTSGDEARICSIKYGGIRGYLEHANLAVGAGKTVALKLVIPMRKRFVKRGSDFSIGMDELELITVNWNSLAGWASGGAVLTNFTGASAYWLVVWHEELSAELKAVDIVRSSAFAANTQCQLALEGAVHDLDLYKTGTTGGGGESLASITAVQCPELGIGDNMPTADLLAHYRRKRDLAPTAFGATPSNEQVLDPFIEGKAIPVIVADENTSAWDGAVVKSAKFNVTSGGGTAGVVALTRQVIDQPEAMAVHLVQTFKVNPARAYVKTDKKSRRRLDHGWTERQLKTACKSFGPIPAARAA